VWWVGGDKFTYRGGISIKILSVDDVSQDFIFNAHTRILSDFEMQILEKGE